MKKRHIFMIVIPILVGNVISNWFFLSHKKEADVKSALFSGVVLTILGVVYSTFQTLFIVRSRSKSN
ncbi:hypothetical protein JOC95_000998 [Bacillus tianshenii]|uniref:Uncharacterized protein n=1 Tax=Sutcliffiella tianshenii TaxID=1463404 RepID=A0ABS2NWZ8_9BACI|nr:hypothetical protein [Bacillus tianshenii]MBM7619149.1 hypothetical protein [Bacillus tianshenii]